MVEDKSERNIKSHSLNSIANYPPAQFALQNAFVSIALSTAYVILILYTSILKKQMNLLDIGKYMTI